MKKIFLSAVMAVSAMFAANAGDLGDYFNANVRPVATMVAEAPAEEAAAEGLKAASTAIMSAEAIDAIMAKTDLPKTAEKLVSQKQGDNEVAIWMVKDGDNSEALILVKTPQQNVAVYACGAEGTLTQMSTM